MDDTEEEIATGLSASSEEIQSFAQELRCYLKETTRPTYELAGQSAQSYNIGYGFTTTSWDCFCAIIAYRNHLNISLPSGAKLDDPDGLLHGSGSRVRHLKVRELADLKTEPVSQILKQARRNALMPVRDAPGEGETPVVQTVIKRPTGGKK